MDIKPGRMLAVRMSAEEVRDALILSARHEVGRKHESPQFDANPVRVKIKPDGTAELIFVEIGS